jgi:hypothetical protein
MSHSTLLIAAIATCVVVTTAKAALEKNDIRDPRVLSQTGTPQSKVQGFDVRIAQQSPPPPNLPEPPQPPQPSPGTPAGGGPSDPSGHPKHGGGPPSVKPPKAEVITPSPEPGSTMIPKTQPGPNPGPIPAQ